MVVSAWVSRYFADEQGNLHTIFKTFAKLRRKHANFLTMSFSDGAREEKFVLFVSGLMPASGAAWVWQAASSPLFMPDPPAALNVESLSRLRDLLRRRLALIADRALREDDPAAQLDQLRRVSEEIVSFHQLHQAVLPARLNHFLERASFQKALEFIDGGG